MIYFLVFIILILCFFYKKIFHIYSLYKLFKNTVDPDNKKNCCTLSYSILKIGYSLFFPPKPLTRFKKHIKIPYEYRDKKYFYLLKVDHKIPIDSIVDENNNDIMEQIYPYLGPNIDCHGSDIFPSDFGLKKVIIKDINDEKYCFDENDTIKI